MTWARKREADIAGAEGEAWRAISRSAMWCWSAPVTQDRTAASALVAAAGARGAGRLHGDGREHRPRHRHAGRLLLSGFGVQPRHAGPRQPGSSFKPFVFAAALDSGFTPATIVVDAPIEVETPRALAPKNASNKFYGPTPLRTGIEQSRNLMTVRIAQEIGMETVADYAERFGVYDRCRPFLANSLGAQETTLFKMVAAYAMFANGGERVEPTLVDRVQDRFGNDRLSP
jgi:hypothetical protein